MPDAERPERAVLDLLDVPAAERILAGTPAPGELWAADYPWADELNALRFFLASGPRVPEAFGLYRIRRASDGVAVGGIGFFGPPDDDGAVTLGYGLVPSARGRGLATAALTATLEIARAAGARRVQAVTDADNVASQAVLLRCGFSLIRTDEQQHYFEHALGTPKAP
ncbi:GNAT family N-acetyltransferase [Psychromicrobium xiongbiense]|uniref:GNAT family N-acetyltransferase n=1 Tax=Psychromicrobium xiongbiense TaxID=3051184 RepID=UPI002555FD35|nr:GNAT family protein [Psychromicrobium sp. YIM S02556]